jgi:hypothetical protein
MVRPDATGHWTGTNGFRLMPGDPFSVSPATLSVTSAAGGHLTSVAYTWRHPDDGPQDGLVVVGAGEEPGSLVALWGDSWHQQPAPMTLTGGAPGREATEGAAEGAMRLDGGYGGGWGWRITLDVAGGATAVLRMANVVPAEHAAPGAPAGPYDVMVLEASRP